jgi:hypothetical protein
LNQNIKWFNIAHHSWSGQMSWVVFISGASLPLCNLSTDWYTFLSIVQFSPYCANIL